MTCKGSCVFCHHFDPIDGPAREITTAYHVEYYERGYWHTESMHVCEAHAKHRADRLDIPGWHWTDLDHRRPTRVVKVTTAVERTVIE